MTANIAERDLGSIAKDIKTRIASVENGLPPGYFLEIGGAYEDMQEAFMIMAGALALAMLLVYMIMASQFESLRHPFVIMFTIPLALIGVLIALLITGKTVSLAVLICVIMLSGIAVNNGIVMVDYTNQLRRKGMEKLEAILQACADNGLDYYPGNAAHGHECFGRIRDESSHGYYCSRRVGCHHAPYPVYYSHNLQSGRARQSQTKQALRRESIVQSILLYYFPVFLCFCFQGAPYSSS